MLDLNQLRVFLTAAETLNFSRAAEKLNLTQPSVTQNIQLLEANVGTPLFHRVGRRLELTETGQSLLPLARQLLSVSQHTEQVVKSLNQEVHGHLRIGCSTTPGKYLLPVLLAEFMRKYPLVQASCQVTSRQTALEMLEQGVVDIALSSSSEELDQNIEFRLFYHDPVVLIVPPGHAWAEREKIEPTELRQAHFIMRESNAGTCRVARAGLAACGIHINELDIILTLGNSEAIAIAVQQGIGVGFISQSVLDQGIASGVVRVPIAGMELFQDIYLCRHRLAESSNLQNTFWEFASR